MMQLHKRSVSDLLSLGVLFALAFTGPSEVCAERVPPPLTDGSTPADVIKVWGEPQEQIEREIKREVEWRYANGSSVTFREGVVTTWTVAAMLRQTPAPGTGTPVGKKDAPVAPVGRVKAKPANDGLDFVREIAREIPSGGDSPASGGELSASPPGEAVSSPPPPAFGQPLVQPPNGGAQVIEPRGRAPGMAQGLELFPLDDGEE